MNIKVENQKRLEKTAVMLASQELNDEKMFALKNQNKQKQSTNLLEYFTSK